MNVTLHQSLAELNAYRKQNEKQKLTIAKLTLPSVSKDVPENFNTTENSNAKKSNAKENLNEAAISNAEEIDISSETERKPLSEIQNTVPSKHVCISEGIVIDEGTCLLLPDEFNGYICADTTADGNCLYNALMAYADEYLVLEVFEKDYSYSDRAFSKANNKRYQQPEYRNIAPFVAEIMEISQPNKKQRLNEIKDDDSIEQWKETKVSLEDQIIANGFVEAFQKRKNSFKGITQQIAADEICELTKSQIGFGQSAVSKIIKRSELPANALTRDAIKLWIEKQTESKAFVV
ncbi:unnamed protein product [Rhizophagus irregularis]|uniref:OTU domain-containing protein n=1 Tax=Rhizophagus irregularis TaxID=588596 RepID=A0A915ZGH5_9GLOM|nr:unnamed protein product [Rhizophagus irregularis]